MKQTSQNETVRVDLPVDFLKRQLARKLDGVNNLLVDCIVETCGNKEALMHVLLGTFEEPKFAVGDMVYCTDTHYHKPEGAEDGTYVEYGECVVIGVNPFNERYRYEVQKHPQIDAVTGETIPGKKTNCRDSHLIPIELVECLGLAE
jgi:hypothetical protein